MIKIIILILMVIILYLCIRFLYKYFICVNKVSDVERG